MAYKQAIVIRTDLDMSRGKIAAQACHASLESALKTMSRDKLHGSNIFKKWRNEGMKKVILKVMSENALKKVQDLAVRNGLVNAMIQDAGLTEVEPGTATALGIGPDDDKKIDKVIGNLGLF